MRQIPIQQDNVTALSADYFNEIPREIENAIESADISLSPDVGPVELNQLGEGLAVYAAGGSYYTGGGIGDFITLSPLGSRRTPPDLFVGMRISFIPPAPNTMIFVAVQLPGTAALICNRGKLANGNIPSIPVGFFTTDTIVTVRLSETDDGLTVYWRVITPSSNDLIGRDSVDTEQLVNGAVDDAKVSDVSLDKITDGGTELIDSYLRFGDSSVTTSNISYLSQTLIDSIRAKGSTYRQRVYLQQGRLYFPSGTNPLGGGPGDEAVRIRRSVFNLTPTSVSVSSRIIDFSFTIAPILTGITEGTFVHRCTVQFLSGLEYSLPASICYPSSPGTDLAIVSISSVIPSSGTGIVGVSDFKLIIDYDPSLVD